MNLSPPRGCGEFLQARVSEISRDPHTRKSGKRWAGERKADGARRHGAMGFRWWSVSAGERKADGDR